MKPGRYARQTSPGLLNLNNHMFRPDWQYLQDHLLWLNDQVTRACELKDYDQADRYLDEMTQILHSLRHVLDTGDLPES